MIQNIEASSAMLKLLLVDLHGLSHICCKCEKIQIENYEEPVIWFELFCW